MICACLVSFYACAIPTAPNIHEIFLFTYILRPRRPCSTPSKADLDFQCSNENINFMTTSVHNIILYCYNRVDLPLHRWIVSEVVYTYLSFACLHPDLMLQAMILQGGI